MKPSKEIIGSVPALLWGDSAEKAYLYVHGQGGCKEEADFFSRLAVPRGWQVLSVDLPGHGERRDKDAFTPWQAAPELEQVMDWAASRWQGVSLYANSIGVYFSQLAFSKKPPAHSLFVSPILDMERLIETMMSWAGVTKERLQREGTIPTNFGQTLSWEYFTWVQAHPVRRWDSPTEILYASGDAMTAWETVESFASRYSCGLTVMENGEHWFHTPEQMAFLTSWAAERL